MSLAKIRKSTRERVRRHRCGNTAAKRQCPHCSAFLSRYAEENETMCSVCFKAHATHEQYVVMEELRETGLAKHPDFCIKGHDLTVHGKITKSSGGQPIRRCGECRRLNQKLYQRKRRARQT